MRLSLGVVLEHAIYLIGQVRRIETCVRTPRRLGLSMIENLLTFIKSSVVCKPSLPLIVVAVKRL